MDRKEALNKEMVNTYLLNPENSKPKEYQNIKLSQSAYKKFFKDESKEEVEKIVERALAMYFRENKQVL